MSKSAEVKAVKSTSRGCVAIKADLTSGWGGAHLKLSSRADITTAEARALAEALVALADTEDAKIAKEADHAERRMKWRKREIAAGRIVVLR